MTDTIENTLADEQTPQEADQIAAAKAAEEQTRRAARIQLEEAERRDDDWALKNLGRLTDAELRSYTMRRWGF